MSYSETTPHPVPSDPHQGQGDFELDSGVGSGLRAPEANPEGGPGHTGSPFLFAGRLNIDGLDSWTTNKLRWIVYIKTVDPAPHILMQGILTRGLARMGLLRRMSYTRGWEVYLVLVSSLTDLEPQDIVDALDPDIRAEMGERWPVDWFEEPWEINGSLQEMTGPYRPAVNPKSRKMRNAYIYVRMDKGRCHEKPDGELIFDRVTPAAGVLDVEHGRVALWARLG